jgi:hypothetical protein
LRSVPRTPCAYFTSASPNSDSSRMYTHPMSSSKRRCANFAECGSAWWLLCSSSPPSQIADRDDVLALVLDLVVAGSRARAHAVSTPGRPERDPDHLDAPDERADEEAEQPDVDPQEQNDPPRAARSSRWRSSQSLGVPLRTSPAPPLPHRVAVYSAPLSMMLRSPSTTAVRVSLPIGERVVLAVAGHPPFVFVAVVSTATRASGSRRAGGSAPHGASAPRWRKRVTHTLVMMYRRSRRTTPASTGGRPASELRACQLLQVGDGSRTNPRNLLILTTGQAGRTIRIPAPREPERRATGAASRDRDQAQRPIAPASPPAVTGPTGRRGALAPRVVLGVPVRDVGSARGARR